MNIPALVRDLVVSTRRASDGRTYRVAYAVPVPGVTAAEVRRSVRAAAVTASRQDEPPLLVSVVTAIPRDADGQPDERALHALPVAESVDPRPVPAAAGPAGRLHLGDVVDLPTPWVVGDLTALGEAQTAREGPSSRCGGERLEVSPDDPPTLVDALLGAARSAPDRGVHVVEGERTESLSYPDLVDAALRTLTGLRSAGVDAGDPVVLHTPSLREHVVGLWACILGGVHPVAVAQAPDYAERNSVLDKLLNVWDDLDSPPVLSGGDTVDALRGYADRVGHGRMRVVDLAECAGAERAEETYPASPDDVAMLQLSSGSTGRSKVIQLTHRGLVRYAQASRVVTSVRTGDVFVNWLPLDHVASVVMQHLGPVILGCDNVHTPTQRVLADPLLWLDLLHRYRAAHAWSPNFGYVLVAEALAGGTDRGWDLSCVRTFVNAGEQCTEPAMTRFVDAVRRFGVDERDLVLSWGMAETCTAICYQRYGPEAVQHVARTTPDLPLELLDGPAPGSTTFLSMGPPAPGAEFRVTGQDGRTVLPERQIGRLQVRSDRVTPGYRNNLAADAEAFPDGDWFDTGDLAFVVDGRMTITGRAKEVIIVNGVHYYCHEIEDEVGSVDGVEPSFVAAFGVRTVEGTERLAVVFVPAGPLSGSVVAGVRRRVGERFGLASVLLAAVDHASFEKTTSGKVQRTSMRNGLVGGELTSAVHAVELAEAGDDTMPDSFYRLDWTPRAFPVGAEPEHVAVVTDRPELARGLRDPVVVPTRHEDWQELLRGSPTHVVVASSRLDSAEPTAESAVDPLLALAAAVGATGWTGDLVTVSRGLHRVREDEPVDYPAALVEGVTEVLGLELPGVRAWHLDLPGSDDDPELVAEALTWEHREPVVVVRDTPMVRGLRRAELRSGGTSAVEPGSCWLVTGGLGGIGRAVLPGLGARLLVVGRGPGDDLAGVGPDVRYARLDVADAAALEAAVADAERAWGTQLSGVLHLAGDYELAAAGSTAPARWHAQVRAKVAGSLAVAAVLGRRPGSRLVAFSSLLSVFPTAGSSAYVAGNRFLEALCAHLAPRTDVRCLTWGAWTGVGMNADRELGETGRDQIMRLSAAEGRALFTAALHQPPGALLLGVDPAAEVLPARPMDAVREPSVDAFGVDVPVAVADQPPSPPRTVAADRPAPQAAGTVGMDRIGIAGVVRDVLRQVVPGGVAADQPFYEAGLGSVQLLRLHALLQEALGVEFPPTTLFTYPTTNDLVQHLGELVEPGADRTGPRASEDRRVAVVGMAARFPGADTLDQYWSNLLEGTVSTRRFDRAELLAAGLPASLVDDPLFVPVTGTVGDIAAFDADLFGVSPSEAALLDPQHRHFLQVCHEALEHGGHLGTDARVGVFAGSGMNLYSLRTYLRGPLAAADPGDQLEALRVAIGNEPDFVATRVAYRLGLTGPAVAVGTACSTSLVAVHLAIQSLLAGEADLALAGASALHVPQAAGYRYEEGSILSRTGVCRPFDAAADGTVGGNGVAAVLLRPLSAALADGDTVHAVILGSAVNNDGADKVGYTSPSVAGQVRVVRDALSAADVDPATVGYLEAHGTGTRLGDPIETAALRAVYGDRSEPLLVGSVKANIGHLDSCAGMAGLVKAVHAVRTGLVPPVAGLSAVNPDLGLDDTSIELPTTRRTWPVPGVRRAGVSAFGVGGTNAHVVVEEPPAAPARDPGPVTLVPLSARGPEALTELALRTATAVESTADLSPADVLTTLDAGRRRLSHRMVACGASSAETAAALRAGGSRTGVVPAGGPGPVVFAFAGQGADCAGAGDGLLDHPAAAAVLRRCTERHLRTWGVDLLDPLRGAPHEWTTATLQPALLAVQLAQVALLDAVGVRPDALVGHSVGELAALCAAGALSEEDAMYLAAVRGALMDARVGAGGMLAVFDEPEVALRHAPELELAVRNGSRHVVLAGPVDAVEAASARLSHAGVDCRRLRVDRAFHTSAMDPVLDELAHHADLLDWQPLRLPMVTGLGGVRLPPGTRLGAEHVRRHAREVADFAAGVDDLVGQGCRTFVELGPSATLTALGRDWSETSWVPLRRAGSAVVADALAELFCHGVEVSWRRLPAADGGRRIPLPTYPFRPTPHWVDHVSTGESSPKGPDAMPAAQDGTGAAHAAVLDTIRELTARHLGDQPDRIAPDVPFFDLGADSLLMINMVRELEVAFGVRVAMRELFEETDTPNRLGAVIVERMDPTRRAELEPAAAPPSTDEHQAPTPAPTAAPTMAAPTAAAATPAAPTRPASTPVAPGHPAPGAEAVVQKQLELMDRLTHVMSEQLSVLAGSAEPEPTTEPTTEPPVQVGPAVSVPRTSGMSGGRLDERQQAHFDDLVDRYTRRTARSKEIAQRHRRRLADSRAVVGFRGATKEMLYPLAARRARGAYLEDVDGNTYVDITMGYGTLLFGHEPSFLTDAVGAYLADGMRLGPRGEETGEAAELLCELTGHDRVAFSTSGTEANSAAFRLARAFTGRDLVVTFDGSYHGHVDQVLGRTLPDGDALRTVPMSAGVPESAVSQTMVLGYGDEASLDVIRRYADRIAAVVLEAVPSRYPDRQPVEFVRALRELCDRHGIVLMFDEMLTGFRPHPQGTQGVFGVRGDLATYGKVIGGGYPIGAIAGRADIMDWVDGGFWSYGDDSVPPGDTVFFGGTYIQHPVSMVAAKAVLTRLRDESPTLQQRLGGTTERLAGTLNEFFVEHEFPVTVHHFGSLFRFAHRGNLELLFNHLVLEGVHVWEWRNFFLSTAHTDADVEFVADAVRNSLCDLRRGGFLPGPTSPSPHPRRELPPVAAPRPAAAPVTTSPAPPEPDAADVASTAPAFSLYFFGDYPSGRQDDKYRGILQAARYVDRAGWHAVWLPERHFDSFGGIFPNPSVLAAALATTTSRVRLNAGSVVLPLHDPIRVAEEWSVVDNLSGGRVGIGMASGWHARDFVLAPDVYGRHREAMYEGFETIRTLWRGDPVSRRAGNGEHVDVALYPRPVQDEPEFYTAIVGNPDSYRNAAAAGIGVVTNLMAQGVDQLAENVTLYRRTREEHGLDPDGGRVVVLVHTFVGADTEQVRAEAFRPFCDYLRSSLSLFGQVTNSLGFAVDLENTPEEDVEYLLTRAYARYCEDRALIGSPADCEPIVRRLAEIGVDEVACFVDFGLPPDRIMAGLPGVDEIRAMFRTDAATVTRELSPAQRQIWYLSRLFPERPTYTESQVVLLEGELDVAALRQAFRAVVDRHESLRSTFVEVDGEPRRVVAARGAVRLPVTDDLGASVQDAAERAMREETEHVFDLAAGPLFEPRLVRLDDRRHLLVLRIQHMVVDTWSCGVIGEELGACYRAALSGDVPELGEPDVPPMPGRADGSGDGLAYWRSTLAGAPTGLPVPTDRPYPKQRTGRGAYVARELAADGVKDLARRHRATAFMVLLAAFAVTLRRLGGQDDMVVGTAFTNRPDGADRAVGFFVNTLPLRLTVSDGETFADLVERTRAVLLDAQEHRSVPFEEIVRDLGGGNPDPDHNPLFEVTVAFDNEVPFELDLPGVEATFLDVPVERAPTDLTLFLTNLGDRVRCRLNYADDVFDAETPRRVLEYFEQVLGSVRAASEVPVDTLDPVPATDAELLAGWQHGGPPAAPAGLLHADHPVTEGVSVVDGHGAVDRGDLRRRVAALVPVLAGHQVGEGSRVAVHLPRGADAVVAMLAVLEVGAVYVPLDPDQPDARIATILAEAEVSVVLTHTSIADALPAELPAVPVDGTEAMPADADAVASTDLATATDDPAYVLFTSGSTGVPKGCVIEHRAITNAVAWYVASLGITGDDRLSWYCSPGFDASCLEVWPALRTGAALHVVPPEQRLDPHRLRDWLVENEITVAFLPTPMAELLLDVDWPPAALRHLVTGGDRLRRRPPAGASFTVWNVYGPTEATVVSTWSPVSPEGTAAPAIGRPVPGTWVRVLDPAGRQVPVGAPGELCVGGTQLGRGYLGSPDLTAERFVDHPEHGRIYRTGDVVRWRPDGELEFLHRSDDQAQIRGHRVEPAEVEHVLRGLPGVRDAAVRSWLRADGSAYLAAYVVASGPGGEVHELRALLAAELPEFLVPEVWSLVDELPLNANGKLDRAALPELEASAPTGQVPPATPVEERLHEIWRAELGSPSVGVESTLFELGGSSLTAIRLLGRIRAEFGVTVSVLDFMRAPTIRQLAATLDDGPADPRVERSAPTSITQRRLYAATKDTELSTFATIAHRVALHGQLDVDALRSALDALVARHPALRTRYVSGGQVQQVLLPEPVPLPEVDVDEAALPEVVREVASRPFDLDAEPAFRVTLLRVGREHAELVLAMHHGVSDGISMTVLYRDLAELYRAAHTGGDPELPELAADHTDFARWEDEYVRDPATTAAVEDWAKEVRRYGDLPLLPTDRPRGDRLSHAGATWQVQLPGDLHDRVRAYAAAANTTPFVVMYAAFCRLQHELTGAPVAAAKCAVANRQEPRFEHVVGLFTRSTWLVVPVDGAATFTDLVARTSDAAWRWLALQAVPLVVLNESLGLTPGTATPSATFSMFDTPMPSLDLPGVAPATPMEVVLDGARGEQTWLLMPGAEGCLDLLVEYSSDLYDERTVETWAARYLTLLRHALTDPDTPLT